MKRLTCEMCGGTDLLKQEGVFVCQSCGCKYSVEEARRMMIEGPVDVSGSTVKVDNTAKLENLYKVARRAREDGNPDQAFKKYEQLQVEDPDNWEPNFYMAYYSGLTTLKNDKPGSSVQVSGGRVKLNYNYRSGIAPCISTIRNSLDSVFSLIEDIEDGDEQRAAVREVYDSVKSVSKILSSVVDTEHERMKREIAHFCDETNDDTSIVMKGIRKSNMGYDNNNVRDGYKSDISDMLSLLETRKKRLEEVVGKRRFDEYWASRQDEKAALEAEKKDITGKIAAWNAGIPQIPGYAEMVNLNRQMQVLEAQKSQLGILKGKEKKAIQAQIDSMNIEYQNVHNSVKPSLEVVKQRITPLENRIAAIDTELTKPR